MIGDVNLLIEEQSSLQTLRFFINESILKVIKLCQRLVMTGGGVPSRIVCRCGVHDAPVMVIGVGPQDYDIVINPRTRDKVFICSSYTYI
jgi:hypothetical protein